MKMVLQFKQVVSPHNTSIDSVCLKSKATSAKSLAESVRARAMVLGRPTGWGFPPCPSLGLQGVQERRARHEKLADGLDVKPLQSPPASTRVKRVVPGGRAKAAMRAAPRKRHGPATAGGGASPSLRNGWADRGKKSAGRLKQEAHRRRMRGGAVGGDLLVTTFSSTEDGLGGMALARSAWPGSVPLLDALAMKWKLARSLSSASRRALSAALSCCTAGSGAQASAEAEKKPL